MRSDLGNLLVRAKVLTETQVAQLQAVAARDGLRFIDALTRSAALTEDGLADFIHRKLLIPRVPPAVLARASIEVARLIDPALAWRHLVLPVSRDHDNNLTLAMADATNTPAVREVTHATGLFIVRAAAPLRPLRKAIERCLGPEETPARDSTTIEPDRVAAEDHAEQTDTSAPVHAGPGDVHDDEPELTPREALTQLLPRLANVADRDQLVSLAVEFLDLSFGRQLVLVHSHDELRSYNSHGDRHLERNTRHLKLPVREPSIFAKVLASRRPYFGPLPQRDDTERRFAEAVGGISGNMLLLPIHVGTKVPLLLFAHPAVHPVDPQAIDGLATALGEALARLLHR